MGVSKRVVRILFGLLCLGLLNSTSFAFALLGPYEPWMQPSNSFRLAGDIGGPMPIGCEYRWNVPVLSYGFDHSFLDYFGTNGVTAVEAAIQTFNDLPSASLLDLNSYPSNSVMVNVAMAGAGVMDLKSEAMIRILEQLGLAQPTRNVFTLRHWESWLGQDQRSWDSPEWLAEYVYGNCIFRRNFDPAGLTNSYWVNGSLYGGIYINTGGQADIVEVVIDPLMPRRTAIADGFDGGIGCYYTGLTRDDVGGIRFLLSSNNINFEYLLPGVRGRGPNVSQWVDGAWRLGVEKLTLLPHPTNSAAGGWNALTNQFTDRYATNGIVVEQQLERVVSTPDFIFSASNTGLGAAYSPQSVRSDTSGWRNYSIENSGTNSSGPGTISGPVVITFHKLGARCITGYVFGNRVENYRWGWFDSVSEFKAVFPASSYSGSSNFVINGSLQYRKPLVTWELPLAVGSTVTIQSSTNLGSWTSLMTVTNNGGVVDWVHQPTNRQQFFRAVPQ